MNKAYSIDDDRHPSASRIALTYGILDPDAVSILIEELAIGNDEPEPAVGPDDCDGNGVIAALQTGLSYVEQGIFLLPGALDLNNRITVPMLATVLQNARIDQLARVCEAINRSAAILEMVQVRNGAPVAPRTAMLIAKLGTAGQFWIDWTNTAPDGGFFETADGLVPESGTAVAMFVTCLNEAGCDYSNAEIRGALGAMMASLDLPEAEADRQLIEA